MNTFGESIRSGRKRQRQPLTQEALGVKVGCSAAAIAHFEVGRKTPSLATAGRLVTAVIEEAVGGEVKVIGLDMAGQTPDGRPRFEIIFSKKGHEPIRFPLEGREPLVEKGNLYQRVIRAKGEQLSMLGHLLMAAIQESDGMAKVLGALGPSQVVREIAERVGRGI